MPPRFFCALGFGFVSILLRCWVHVQHGAYTPQNQITMNCFPTLHSLRPEERAALIEILGNLLDQLRFEISELEYELVWAALIREIEGL